MTDNDFCACLGIKAAQAWASGGMGYPNAIMSGIRGVDTGHKRCGRYFRDSAKAAGTEGKRKTFRRNGPKHRK